MKALALLVLLMAGCSSVDSKPAVSPVFTPLYEVKCVADGGGFDIRDATSFKLHTENAHYLEVHFDEGVVYHYILDGETCGAKKQQDILPDDFRAR